jgi:hypothetical protein
MGSKSTMERRAAGDTRCLDRHVRRSKGPMILLRVAQSDSSSASGNVAHQSNGAGCSGLLNLEPSASF